LETAIVDLPLTGVGRDGAMTIPTIAACRNLIVGAAAQMAVFTYRGTTRLDPGPLLTQPDPDTTWIATLGGTLDDLLFFGRAYWLVLAYDGAGSEQNPEGFPVRARWIPAYDVTPKLGRSRGAYSVLEGYNVAGVRDTIPPRGMIRFDSPLPGVLHTAGRTIASAIALESAARRLAEVELPAGILTNEGEWLSDEELADYGAKFQANRAQNGLGVVQGFTYERVSLNAEDLQLIQARDRVDTDCARLFNVPVAMVGASPSGNASALLYQNVGQNLTTFVTTAVAPHLKTVETTLSLPSVTPRGQKVAFDVQTFLRADPEAAAQYARELYAADLISRDEARGFIGIPSNSEVLDIEPGRV
jgi:phage portal protein BeeE